MTDKEILKEITQSTSYEIEHVEGGIYTLKHTTSHPLSRITYVSGTKLVILNCPYDNEEVRESLKPLVDKMNKEDK